MFEEDSKRRKGNKQNVNDKAEEMKRCRRILKNGKAKKVFHCEKTARCPANEVKSKLHGETQQKGPMCRYVKFRHLNQFKWEISTVWNQLIWKIKGFPTGWAAGRWGHKTFRVDPERTTQIFIISALENGVLWRRGCCREFNPCTKTSSTIHNL